MQNLHKNMQNMLKNIKISSIIKQNMLNNLKER